MNNLVVRMLRSSPNVITRLALCDAEGDPLPGQIDCTLHQPAHREGLATLTVRFAVTGTAVRLEDHSVEAPEAVLCSELANADFVRTEPMVLEGQPSGRALLFGFADPADAEAALTQAAVVIAGGGRA
jgi:hypothetical protein